MDLGSESGSTSLRLINKGLEVIVKFCSVIYKLCSQATYRKLQKLQLQEMLNRKEQKKIINKIDGKVGYVNYKLLKKSGIQLSFLGVLMSRKDMKEFCAICKRERIQISALRRKKETSNNDKPCYELICKTQDLEDMSKFVEQLNYEKMTREIDNRMQEIKSKGVLSLTKQDQIDLAFLHNQKMMIQKKHYMTFNNVPESKFTNDTLIEQLSLDAALDRDIKRRLNKDLYFIVADNENPERCIRCHTYTATYKGSSYAKTDYEVFVGDEKVLETHDGKFDGRPINYWQKQKQDIKTTGKFSNNLIKFDSEFEYQMWREELKKQVHVYNKLNRLETEINNLNTTMSMAATEIDGKSHLTEEKIADDRSCMEDVKKRISHEKSKAVKTLSKAEPIKMQKQTKRR